MHYLHLCQHVPIFKIYLSTANFRDLRARAQRWRWKSGESCPAKTKLLLAVADQGWRWGPVHVVNQSLEAISSVLVTRHLFLIEALQWRILTANWPPDIFDSLFPIKSTLILPDGKSWTYMASENVQKLSKHIYRGEVLSTHIFQMIVASH